jgi:hypothetical protein
MLMWLTPNWDIVEEQQRERLAEIKAIYEQRRQLELAGYVPPSGRVRATAARWLLRLAVLLDRGSVEPTLRHA